MVSRLKFDFNNQVLKKGKKIFYFYSNKSNVFLLKRDFKFKQRKYYYPLYLDDLMT